MPIKELNSTVAFTIFVSPTNYILISISMNYIKIGFNYFDSLYGIVTI